jgi:hypothetical protein
MGKQQNDIGKAFERRMTKHLQELKQAGLLKMALFTGGFHGTPWDHLALTELRTFAIECKTFDGREGHKFPMSYLSGDEWSGLSAWKGPNRTALVVVSCSDNTVWAFDFEYLSLMKRSGAKSVELCHVTAELVGLGDEMFMQKVLA